VPHYPASFSINRLAFPAHLGVYDAERAALQPVSVQLRLYFPQSPACTQSDTARFIDYSALSDALTKAGTTREFRLIEFMAQELFSIARSYLDAHDGAAVKLWLCLTKLAPKVDYLEQGASFTLCDLPADATLTPVM